MGTLLCPRSPALAAGAAACPALEFSHPDPLLQPRGTETRVLGRRSSPTPWGGPRSSMGQGKGKGTSQALLLTGDFKHPGTCWKDNTGGHQHSRRFLGCIEDNILLQVAEEPRRKGAVLDLGLPNGGTGGGSLVKFLRTGKGETTLKFTKGQKGDPGNPRSVGLTSAPGGIVGQMENEDEVIPSWEGW
ncbi:uncharacterized protein O3Q21_000655 [Podargus strigoides]